MHEIPHLYLVGYGAIGQALTPLLISRLGLNPHHITAIDPRAESRHLVESYGINFQCLEITPENLVKTLDELVVPGSLLINVAVNVSSIELIRWCQAHAVLYLDTCVEPWKGNYGVGRHNEDSITNYELRHEVLELRRDGAPTAVIAHGANPGLVTHFVKTALQKLAKNRGIAHWQSWAELADRLGVRCIQVAERDTQGAAADLSKFDFVNTWSVDGFISEAWQYAELGWGSHEKQLPERASEHGFGDRAGICLATRGAETRVKSWVPSRGAQTGMLITHHEALSIASWLTLRDAAGNVRYRPTAYYAYCPSPETQRSVKRWIASSYQKVSKRRVLREELNDGCDELGVLMVFDGGCYWYGSTLTLREARTLVPGNNATTLQVVAGILGAVQWMRKNPRRGVVEAEDMDHEVVLEVAKPFLGKVHGVLAQWQPADKSDLQFADFLADGPESSAQNVRARSQ